MDERKPEPEPQSGESPPSGEEREARAGACPFARLMNGLCGNEHLRQAREHLSESVAELLRTARSALDARVSWIEQQGRPSVSRSAAHLLRALGSVVDAQLEWVKRCRAAHERSYRKIEVD